MNYKTIIEFSIKEKGLRGKWPKSDKRTNNSWQCVCTYSRVCLHIECI